MSSARLVAASFALQGLTAIAFQGLGSISPLLLDEFGISRAQTGLLVTAANVVAAPSALIGGLLVARDGGALALRVGPLLSGLAFFILAQTRSYPLALAAACLAGLGPGLVVGAVNRTLVLSFPLARRATVFGLMLSAVLVAPAVSSLVLPPIALAWGWRVAVVVAGLAISVGAWPGGMLILRSASIAPPWKSLLANPLLAEMIVVALLNGAIQMSVVAHAVLYMQGSLRLPLSVAAVYFAAVQFSGAAGRPVFGALCDRFAPVRRFRFLQVFALIASAGFLLLAAAPSVTKGAFAPAILVLLGFVAIGWSGVVQTTYAETAGAVDAAAWTGLVLAFGFIGQVLGPTLVGVVADVADDYSPAWAALAGASALFFFIVGRADRLRRHAAALRLAP